MMRALCLLFLFAVVIAGNMSEAEGHHNLSHVFSHISCQEGSMMICNPIEISCTGEMTSIGSCVIVSCPTDCNTVLPTRMNILIPENPGAYTVPLEKATITINKSVDGSLSITAHTQEPGYVYLQVRFKKGISLKELPGKYMVIEPDPVVVWIVEDGETVSFTAEQASYIENVSVEFAGCDLDVKIRYPAENQEFTVGGGARALVDLRFFVLSRGTKVFVPRENISLLIDGKETPVPLEFDTTTMEYKGAVELSEGKHKILVSVSLGTCKDEDKVDVAVSTTVSIPENPVFVLGVVLCLAALLAA